MKRYIHICPVCNLEREVGYVTHWEIKTNRVSGICKKCSSPKNGFIKGNIPKKPFIKGQKAWNRGIKTGLVPKTAFKKGFIPWNTGKIGFLSGENHYNWKGGITTENIKIRHSLEYIKWRELVFIRDNYTCVNCGDRQSKGHKVILNADHIKPFSLFPELRFELSNGRTLCKECHKLIGWELFRENNPRRTNVQI